MHYAAHFSDLEHEIKPVTSGYRFVLVYSLCSVGKIDDHISHNSTYYGPLDYAFRRSLTFSDHGKNYYNLKG